MMKRSECDERVIGQALVKRRAEGWLEVIDGDAAVTEGLRDKAERAAAIRPMRNWMPSTIDPRNTKAACEHPKPILRRNQVDTDITSSLAAAKHQGKSWV